MTRRPWTKAELRTLRREFPHVASAVLARSLGRTVTSVNGMACKLGMHKSEAYLASPAACRLRRGDNVGSRYRYPKGHVLANKGLRRPGYAPGNMAATQFKRGQKSWNWLPWGSLRYSKEGYLQQKCYDTGYPPKDWVPVHHLVWEEATGKRVPKEMRLIFRDGCKENFDVSNLEMVSPAEMMRRNSIHTLPAPLKEVIVLRGAINRRINRRMRHAKEQAQRSA